MEGVVLGEEFLVGASGTDFVASSTESMEVVGGAKAVSQMAVWTEGGMIYWQECYPEGIVSFEDGG
jgi:hypothetical protein